MIDYLRGGLFERPPPLTFPVVDGHPPAFPGPIPFPAPGRAPPPLLLLLRPLLFGIMIATTTCSENDAVYSINHSVEGHWQPFHPVKQRKKKILSDRDVDITA
jgi:hypothetical protein